MTRRQEDFYHCLTEKMLTYALGRGVEYYDVQTEDVIVQRLTQTSGKPSELLMGIITSAPFQRTRLSGDHAQLESSNKLQQRADLILKP